MPRFAIIDSAYADGRFGVRDTRNVYQSFYLRDAILRDVVITLLNAQPEPLILPAPDDPRTRHKHDTPEKLQKTLKLAGHVLRDRRFG